MTIRQAAKVLGLKVRTIRGYVQSGKIKAVKGSDNAWHIPEEIIYGKEVQEIANKGRKHSARLAWRATMGVRERDGQDPEKSAQREKCEGERSDDMGNI